MQAAEAKAAVARKPIKFGIATYSYWHFRTEKVPIETVMDKEAEIGVEAVDIMHRQMDIEENAPLDAAGRSYLRKLKRHAFRNGLSICCVSTHQSFVRPKPEELTEHVEPTKKCIEIAYELGCPCIRINTGRWGTSKDFDELMKKRGIEPPLPGYKEEDGFPWVIESLGECAKFAEKHGVVLVQVTVVVPLHVPLVLTAETQSTNPGSGSLTVTPPALEGPVLVTTSV